MLLTEGICKTIATTYAWLMLKAASTHGVWACVCVFIFGVLCMFAVLVCWLVYFWRVVKVLRSCLLVGVYFWRVVYVLCSCLLVGVYFLVCS